MEQKEKKRRKKKSSRGAYYDYNLLAIVILLICFGLIMLYSTSAYEAQMKFHGDDMYYFRRQALISVGAIAVAIFISKWDYHLMIPFAGTLYLISVVLMAMVRFTPFGVEAYGSRRWLKLGIQFQPAEIAKIAIIIYMPILVIKMGKQVKQLRAVIWLLIFGMIQAGAAFVFTDNLSTGMIIGGIAVVMIFIAHPKTKPFVVLALGTSVVAGSVIAYMGMTMLPVITFVSEESYPGCIRRPICHPAATRCCRDCTQSEAADFSEKDLATVRRSWERFRRRRMI